MDDRTDAIVEQCLQCKGESPSDVSNSVVNFRDYYSIPANLKSAYDELVRDKLVGAMFDNPPGIFNPKRNLIVLFQNKKTKRIHRVPATTLDQYLSENHSHRFKGVNYYYRVTIGEGENDVVIIDGNDYFRLLSLLGKCDKMDPVAYPQWFYRPGFQDYVDTFYKYGYLPDYITRRGIRPKPKQKQNRNYVGHHGRPDEIKSIGDFFFSLFRPF